MSNATAKITRQSTGPEMSDYLDNEIYSLCEAIQDNGQTLKSGGLASIKFIELFKVSVESGGLVGWWRGWAGGLVHSEAWRQLCWPSSARLNPPIAHRLPPPPLRPA